MDKSEAALVLAAALIVMVPLHAVVFLWFGGTFKDWLAGWKLPPFR